MKKTHTTLKDIFSTFNLFMYIILCIGGLIYYMYVFPMCMDI